MKQTDKKTTLMCDDLIKLVQVTYSNILRYIKIEVLNISKFRKDGCYMAFNRCIRCWNVYCRISTVGVEWERRCLELSESADSTDYDKFLMLYILSMLIINTFANYMDRWNVITDRETWDLFIYFSIFILTFKDLQFPDQVVTVAISFLKTRNKILQITSFVFNPYRVLFLFSFCPLVKFCLDLLKFCYFYCSASVHSA
jgi:hypothetical protein